MQFLFSALHGALLCVTAKESHGEEVEGSRSWSVAGVPSTAAARPR